MPRTRAPRGHLRYPGDMPMTHAAARLPFTRRPISVLAMAMSLALCAAAALTEAQAPAKKALTIDDYTKWRSISGQELSGDGTWAAYVLQQLNTIAAEAKPVLHLRNLDTNAEVTVNDATAPDFSPDSKWMAYQVDPGAAERARAARRASGSTPGGAAPASPGQEGGRGGAGAMPPRRVELRNLETGAIRSWENIGTVVFSPTSTHLVLQRRGAGTAEATGGRGGGAPGGGAQGGGRGGGGTSPSGPRGLDVILIDLRTGGHQLLGSVGDIAFNRTGEWLAFTVDSPVKDGNGLFVFDTRSGRITPLDNDGKQYSRLAWNDAGTAVAVLKGSDVEKMREKANVLLAFPDIPSAAKDGAPVPTPIVLDPAKAEGFPKGWVVSDRAPLAWSDDNARVFFGMKEQVPAPDTTRRSTDETPDVDVWNTADERVQSRQMIQANQDRNFTFRQAFDVRAARFVKLADETMKDLDVAPDGRWAVGRDGRGYILDTKEPAADFYRVNTSTGERTLIAKGQLTGRHVFGISPHGSHFLYLEGRQGPGVRPRRRRRPHARRAGGPELRGRGRRSSGHQAGIRDRRLRERRQGGHRQSPVRFVAAAARRIGGGEPHRRPGHEERDPLPPHPHGARRSDAAEVGRPPRDVRPDQAAHALGLRPVDEEGWLL